MLTAAAGALFALSSTAVWHVGNQTTKFAYFRSPRFILPPGNITSFPLLFTALPSPNVAAHGTTQSKLLGAIIVLINGVEVTAGPGHNAPPSLQAVRRIDLHGLDLLRPAPEENVIAVRSFFTNQWFSVTDPSAVPRIQLLLQALPSNGGPSLLNVSTSTDWVAYDAGHYHSPGGDAANHSSWYHVPEENLDARARPVGWADPTFNASAGWTSAIAQPSFPTTFYVDASPPPAFLSREACAVTTLPSGATLVDFGQELMGGVNFSFAEVGFPSGTTATIFLGEELYANGSVMVPSRSGVNYTSRWTLTSAGDAANAGMMAHEFIQFRYAQISHDSPPLASSGARAWVVQAPFGGDGANPFEIPCARSVPLVPARADPALKPVAFSSSFPAIDCVFNFTAYTVVATSLDVNVDSQTRQRDECHLDAFITSEEAFAVFPSGDPSIAARTARYGATNSSGIFDSNSEFHASAVLMVALYTMETGDLSLARETWASSDDAFNSDAFPDDYIALQFLSGIRYAGNASAGGLLYFPADCGGPWGCDPLIDWPTQTRDGYVVSPQDAIRNGIDARAIRALGMLANELGETAAAVRYNTVADGIRAAMIERLLRYNATSGEAFFVDGVDGKAAAHAAIHSTIYAIAGAGVADVAVGEGPSPLAGQLSAYLRRRDTGGSSCMLARWLVDALFRLGISDSAAADAALDLLSRKSYPGWGFMIEIGATTTLEAWQPADKWNTDFSHPWCASPASLIPRLWAGVSPLEPGWRRARVAPLPGNVSNFYISAPTLRGALNVRFKQVTGGGVTLNVSVPTGTTAQVCLPPLHADFAPVVTTAGDTIVVDGENVTSVVWGRMLCAAVDVKEGAHVVQRI